MGLLLCQSLEFEKMYYSMLNRSLMNKLVPGYIHISQILSLNIPLKKKLVCLRWQI